MNNESNFGLSAPVVPVAGNDDLIKTVDLESDILVPFPVWRGVEQRNYKTLLPPLFFHAPTKPWRIIHQGFIFIKNKYLPLYT